MVNNSSVLVITHIGVADPDQIKTRPGMEWGPLICQEILRADIAAVTFCGDTSFLNGLIVSDW